MTGPVWVFVGAGIFWLLVWATATAVDSRGRSRDRKRERRS